MLTSKAIYEIQELSRESQRLVRGTAGQRKEAEVLQNRIRSIEKAGMSTDEMRSQYVAALVESTSRPKTQAEERHRKSFDSYLRSGDDTELRDVLSGQQSIVYTQGAPGGYMVPDETDEIVYTANAQVDPILDRNVTSFTMTPGPFLQPSQVSGYDLSTVTATIVGETVQQNPGAFPPVAGGVLRSDITFRASFAASLEAAQDIPNFTEKIIRAGATALARKIGQSVMDGHGGVDVSGLTQNLASSYSNATSGKLTLTDLLAIMFSVNRFYRSSARCAWLLPDQVYKLVRAATDNNGRPLLETSGDDELLLGKKVYISPSLARAYSSIGIQGALIFGDLSHLIVRASRPTVQVAIESAQHGVDVGECLYIFRQRADANYFDPSNGSVPPLVLATIS